MQETFQTEEVEEPKSLQIILIVEDDVSIGELLVLTLKDMTPYQVLHVQDGFAALKTVRSVIPRLIFLDYQLPGMDGLECLEVFRAAKGMEQVPIIFMSANLPDQARSHNDVFLLEKPFELASVIHLVKQALGDEEGSSL